MRRYETIFILDAAVAEADRATYLGRLQDIIGQYQGVLLNFDHWGELKLAYEIRGKGRGYYVRMDYCGDGALVNELERHFRITDSYLKFLTVLLEKDVDAEALLESLQATSEAEVAPAAGAVAEAKTAPVVAAEAAETVVEDTAAPETATSDTESDQAPEENEKS